MRFYISARQTNSLLCVFSLTHGKYFFPPHVTPLACSLPLPCARTRHTEKTLPMSCVVGKRAVRFHLAHGKHIRFRVFFHSARQSIFKKIDFCTSFYFSTSTMLFCTLYFNFTHASINLQFLTIMCHL
jgi:hypothetical protein